MVGEERARGESLKWWEPARRNRGNYTTMLKEGEKKKKGAGAARFTPPSPPPPPPPPTPQFGKSRGSFYHLSHISYSKLIKLNGPIALSSGAIVCLTLKLTDNNIIIM